MRGAGQQLGADAAFDLGAEIRVLRQPARGVLLALADALVVVAVPGTGLLDDAFLNAEVDDLAVAVDAFAVEDLELRLAERRRDLVLHHLDAGFVADHLVAVLDGADAADVQTHGGVELERVAAGGGLRRTEHDADLHADLVGEDHQRVGVLDAAGHLAQRLAHQPRLQADVGIAHVAFDLGLGRERGHGIHDHHVHRARAHDHVADFQALFAGVRLRHQKVVRVHAQGLRVDRVQGVFGVDERTGAARLLRFRDDLEGERGLAGGLGAVDFHHPAPGQAADAQRDVQPQRAGGNGGNRLLLVISEAHHRTLAELPVDLRQRRLQGTALFRGHGLWRRRFSALCLRGGLRLGTDIAHGYLRMCAVGRFRRTVCFVSSGVKRFFEKKREGEKADVRRVFRCRRACRKARLGRTGLGCVE